jgi:hypothetical protein
MGRRSETFLKLSGILDSLQFCAHCCRSHIYEMELVLGESSRKRTVTLRLRFGTRLRTCVAYKVLYCTDESYMTCYTLLDILHVPALHSELTHKHTLTKQSTHYRERHTTVTMAFCIGIYSHLLFVKLYNCSLKL